MLLTVNELNDIQFLKVYVKVSFFSFELHRLRSCEFCKPFKYILN